MPQRLLDDQLSAAMFAEGLDAAPLPDRARVVVVGGGIVGASVAYHLAERGIRDVVLLERERLSSGTSWHAAGLLARVRASHALTELARYAPDLYAAVGAETGVDTCVELAGSLTTAQHDERMRELLYGAAIARHHGIAAHVLTPGEVTQHWPLAVADGLVGGVFYPEDGHCNPGHVAIALAAAAHARGVAIRERAPVTGFRLDGARIAAIETARGVIACETVVLAAGLWSRDLAARAGASAPLYAAAHIHVHSQPLDPPLVPVLRELDGYFYVRQSGDRLLVGAFEPDGKPRSVVSLGDDFAFGEFGADWEHFAPVRALAERRIPVVKEIGFDRFLNAPESFTPDAAFLLGETPEVGGLFVAAGFNSQGIIYAAGAGRALAAWIEDGAPAFDASGVDIARFAPAQSVRRYLHRRTVEGLGRLYAMHWPYLQPETARGVRRTVLYERLAAAGACFGEAAGWERANWFGEPGERPTYTYTYGRPAWFDQVGREHRAARDAVALFDLSTFAKVEVAGPGALATLQRLCTADLDVAVGRVVYTLALNERGGIELDGTVTRLAADRFLVVTPTVYQAKTVHWLRRGARAATVTDVTSAFATLAVMGPQSRELVQRLTPDDVSADAFRFGWARELEIGDCYAQALRVSFVGELGFELYPPTEYAPGLFDDLVAAGADLGLRLAGYHALDSLRQEKGYVHLGHDVGPAEDPYVARLGFTVALAKGDFVGREAIARQAQDIPSRLRVHVRLADPAALLLHDESIMRNGEIVGQVTSGAYGFTLGAAVGTGYVTRAEGVTSEWIAAGDFAVDVCGDRVPAIVTTTPFHDPGDVRLRS